MLQPQGLSLLVIILIITLSWTSIAVISVETKPSVRSRTTATAGGLSSNNVHQGTTGGEFISYPLRTVDVLNTRTNRSSLPEFLSSKISDTVALSVTDTDTTGKPKDDVRELYFTQLLDHYHNNNDNNNNNDSNEVQTFQQRYFRSNRYMRSSTNVDHSSIITTNPIVTVIFICVGGEGPAFDESVLIDSVHCTGDMIESAQQLYSTYPWISVVLIALEHRYYGSSYPIFMNTDTNQRESPVTNENLVYLSSRQATADLAHFIHTMFMTHEKVYLFGGSYPGMVAAFTRAKYPYLIQGAISNSAPVQAVLNFDTYQSHVGYNIKQIDMNCYNIVTIGHMAITKLLKRNETTDLTSLAEKFNLCHPNTVLLNRENQNLFVGDGVVYFGAQENDPHCTTINCNMEQKCNVLTAQYTKEINNDNTTSIETATINALAYLTRIQQQKQQQQNGRIRNSLSGDNCFVVDWNETLDYINDPILGQTDGLRSWLYQTCTEFGFYQTCQDSKCPFGIGYHLLSQDLLICQHAFHIYNTIQAVQATNEWTGGWHNIQSTPRILSVTGTVDPWSEMAIQHTKSNTNNTFDYPIPYQVLGASHHFWTHPSKDTDDDSIIAARQHIYQTLHNWIMYDFGNNIRTTVPQ